MRRLLFVAIASLFLVFACDDPPVQIPPVGTGPGGGQFIVQCNSPVASGMFDPVVYPGQQMAGHNHEFYGNKTISPNSTYGNLVGKPTACENPGDTAAYWHPTLYQNGHRVIAPKSTFYYNENGSGPVRAFPKGLKMIAGNKAATAPQDTSIVNWGCGNGSGTSEINHPPQCSGDGRLTFHIVFPDCWNGKQLDSADHKSHVSYSDHGHCDSAHPYHLVQLTIRIEYTHFQPAPSSLSLASMTSSGQPTSHGSVNTLHADFVNAWDQGKLQRDVQQCVNAGRDCSADEAAGL